MFPPSTPHPLGDDDWPRSLLSQKPWRHGADITAQPTRHTGMPSSSMYIPLDSQSPYHAPPPPHVVRRRIFLLIASAITISMASALLLPKIFAASPSPKVPIIPTQNAFVPASGDTHGTHIPLPTHAPISTYPPTAPTLPGQSKPTPFPTYTPYPTYTPWPSPTPRPGDTATPTLAPLSTLDDPMADLSHTFATSGNLAENAIGPDSTIINRTVNDNEWIVWHFPHIANIRITAYYCTVAGPNDCAQPTDVIPLTIEVSTDNLTWDAAPTQMSLTPLPGRDWSQAVWTASGMDTAYVRVTWNTDSQQQVWNPCLGEADFSYRP